jgi:hypothetical protein
MKKITLLLLLFMSTYVFTQNTKDVLLNDLVKIKDNKYTISDYTLLTSDEKSIQVKAYAEAPVSGLISRDYFVLIFSQITGQYISDLVEQYDLDTKNLTELIGNPDMVISVYMVKSGIQIETSFNGRSERKTMTWNEFLE